MVSKAAVLSEVYAPAGKVQKAKTANLNKKSTVATTPNNNQQPKSMGKANQKKENSKVNLPVENTGQGGAGSFDAAEKQQESTTCCLIM